MRPAPTPLSTQSIRTVFGLRKYWPCGCDSPNLIKVSLRDACRMTLISIRAILLQRSVYGHKNKHQQIIYNHTVRVNSAAVVQREDARLKFAEWRSDSSLLHHVRKLRLYKRVCEQSRDGESGITRGCGPLVLGFECQSLHQPLVRWPDLWL